MTIEELLKFIKQEHKRLLQFYHFKSNQELKYPIALKIGEELGELYEDVLASDALQRKIKLKAQKPHLDEEMADVILTTLLLAENMQIDIHKGLEKKIRKIKKRKY